MSSSVSAITREDLMNELAQSLADVDGLADDEFTVEQYAQHKNIRHSLAGEILRRQWKKGKYTRRSVIHEGSRCHAYRKA